jgi:hypothetical protein
MSAGRRDFSRVLIVLAVVLVGIFLTFDLIQPDSFVRSLFGSGSSQSVRQLDVLDAVRRTR